MCCRLIIGLYFLSNLVSFAYGEVILDGSLNAAAGPLPGPHFVIDASLGQQVGDNLFHSFERFNLNSTESATFTGPSTLNHVINRITGGQPSYINGLLRSQISHADLYFINPWGILFGPQAQLDIPASLYLSTADYLQLGENGHFNATTPNNTLLTTAAPTAFGFLDNPSTITIQNSQLILRTDAIEQAVGEQTLLNHPLALIGGDITIQDSLLSTFGSDINIVSVNSAGKVPLNVNLLAKNTFTNYGTLRINDTNPIDKRYSGNIQTSGRGGGAIFIRVGQLFLDGGWLFADTLGDQPGRGVTIQVDKEMVLTNAARITTEVIDNALFGKATGTAGHIDIHANQLQLTGGSQIASSSYTASAAGDIHIALNDSLLVSGIDPNIQLPSGILSNTTSNGSGGTISITAPQVRLEQAAQLHANTIGEGQAGHISLQVDTLAIQDGAQIAVGVGDQKHLQGAGKGGNMTITAANAIQISGKSLTLNQPSGLFSNVFTQNGSGGQLNVVAPQLTIDQDATIQAMTLFNGQGGHVNLQVDTLKLIEGGTILTNTLYGSGFGGHIDIIARRALQISGNNTGIAAATGSRSTGVGGYVNINASQLELVSGGALSARSEGMGNAGNIYLSLQDQLRMKQGSIRTSTAQADGGNIEITTPSYLHLTNSELTATVNAQAGDGGNITLTSDFVILDHSHIFAKAVGGTGGNIDITTTGIYNLSQEPLEQVIDASSQLGVDGVVTISPLDQNTTEKVLILPNNFFDVSALLTKKCNQFRENTNSLTFKKLFGTIHSPDDWKANHLWNPYRNNAKSR
jgi:filamentous hemagglutinin family protein